MATAPVARLVAERVRQLRRRRNWSAQQLADACADAGMKTLTRGTIAKIESGVRKSVSAAEVQVLAKVLGVTPNELLAPGSRQPDRRLSLSESLRPLVDVLEQVPFLQEPAGVSLYLDLLADQLGEPLDLPEHAELRHLLYALVFACAQIPGGLRALAEVLQILNPGSSHAAEARDLAAELDVADFLAPGQREQLLTLLAGQDRRWLAALYRTAAAPYGADVHPDVDDARRLVVRLEQMNMAPGGVPPLLLFAELVAAGAEPSVAAALHEWSGTVAGRLGLGIACGRSGGERPSKRCPCRAWPTPT
ncbi:helix-turn-helix domain-containing protein [Amycolatopsis sp. Hca4]|uniref:effector-associated domain 2-containing protein n=1 Tax=Amycolatopsis sp. Hca4 TaxID=2742131 RepID=UPI0015901232|nr:helix-turn-helix domain-containing protein [Amycolatopsis sp. Hca4]QKV72438.1 helix-turn-helix transcriptional regulator [Amycolatopsis sp. Hca4]